MKKPLLKCQFPCIFTTLDLIWLKFCPKDQSHFAFFVYFQWNMFGNSININNLCCNLVVLKINWWNLFFEPNFHKINRGHYRARPQWKTIFWAEMTKADHQLSETFYFNKMTIFWLSYEPFSIMSDVFCQESAISS